MTQNLHALLVLQDGTLFWGKSIGAEGSTVGEVVFNTAMTGYQEILTDPSYTEQIVTFTYPHIGNTGTNSHDNESDRAYVKGLIIRDLPLLASNFRNQENLGDFLRRSGIVAISDIDTRKLTRILREKGAQHGSILTSAHRNEQVVTQALSLVQGFTGLNGRDLAQTVTCAQPYEWLQGSYHMQKDSAPIRARADFPYHVVAYDYGIKHNILRLLVDRGCRVSVVPAKTPAAEVQALQPDGVFFSNGPGDPAPCDYAIAALQTFLKTDIPLFGICLGHQLLGLAAGAKTIKMKFGHHGSNHPVQDLQQKKVLISSQNHGFAIDEASLPANLYVTHRSLFDGTLQGIHHKTRPAFGFQGHPEASPGPHDMAPLFDHFIELIQHYKQMR